MEKRYRIYHPIDGYITKEFKKKTSAERYKEKYDIRGSIVRRDKGYLINIFD